MGVNVAICKHEKSSVVDVPSRSSTSGMTMLELLIVLAIIGVISAISAPSLATLLGSIRFDIHHGQLVRDLNLTRGEAVKRGNRVVMRITSDLWASGWRVFEDKDADDAYTTGDEELLVRSALSDATLTSTDFPAFIRYTGSGASNTTGMFTLESTGSSSKEIVCIGGTGRLKLSQCPTALDPCELADPCP